MATGDGLLVRLRPRAGRLTAGEARALAARSEALGRGQIELTSRGSLQLRGFTEHSARAFAGLAVAAGLADPDPLRERIRSAILVPPLADSGTALFAEALAAALAADPQLRALPAKLLLRLDAPRGLSLASLAADLAFAPQCDPPAVAGALARIDAWLRDQPPRLQPAAPAPTVIGPLHGHAAFGLGVPFGALPAARLADCADLAAAAGDGLLHLTPWRAVLLGGVRHLSPDAIPAGLIADPDDPRLRLSACIGLPGCSRATSDTRADALAFAPSLPPGAHLHVAGCAKLCGRPPSADLVLVAAAGRYDRL